MRSYRPDHVEKVLACYQHGAGRRVTIREVVAETGLSLDCVHWVCGVLVSEGRLEQAADRSYRVPGTGAEGLLREARALLGILLYHQVARSILADEGVEDLIARIDRQLGAPGVQAGTKRLLRRVRDAVRAGGEV